MLFGWCCNKNNVDDVGYEAEKEYDRDNLKSEVKTYNIKENEV